MDYMSIDNKPSNELRVMGEFKSFTQDRLEDLWTRTMDEQYKYQTKAVYMAAYLK